MNALAHAQQVVGSAQPENTRFKVEIQSQTDGHPQIVVTNLYEHPLTACFLEVSLSSDADSRKSKMMWDSYSYSQNLAPVPMNSRLSVPLPHIVGKPFPDEVEVVAAVWADGTTTGNPELLDIILRSRTTFKRAYEWAISLLQTGLKEDWTRAMYLAELNRDENKEFLHSLPGRSMKSTFEANSNMDEHQKVRQTVVQHLLDAFTKKRDELLQLKPNGGTEKNTSGL